MKDNAQQVWDNLKSIPVTDYMETEEKFLHFDKGTDIYQIWHWIEDKFDVSIVKDLK